MDNIVTKHTYSLELIQEDYNKGIKMHDLIHALRDYINDLPEHIKLRNFSEFELPVRPANILIRENIKTPRDLALISPQKIASWSGLGIKSVGDIYNSLKRAENAVHLGGEAVQYLSEDFSTKRARIQENAEKDSLTSAILNNLIPFSDWLRNYGLAYPQHIELFKGLKIEDDLDYISQRHNLPPKIMAESDNYRFTQSCDFLDKENPLSIVAVSPVWLLQMDIKYFQCSARLKKLIIQQNITSLADFLEFTSSELCLLPNIGRKSLSDLSDCIIAAYHKGRPPEITEVIASPNYTRTSLKDAFFASLNDLNNSRQKQIIEKRLGVSGKIETLEEIAQKFNITRERVRQIEQKALRILRHEFWTEILAEKITAMLKNTRSPVFIHGIGAYDQWFQGFEGNYTLFEKLLANFSRGNAFFVSANNQTFLSQLSQGDWNNLRDAILFDLEKASTLNYTIDDVELLIKYKLDQAEISYCAELMYAEIRQKLNFSFIDDELFLTSLGDNQSSRLKTTLEECDEPKHYSEIKKLYKKRYGIDVSERSIHACLSNGEFCLFDRGTYGLKKHLLFTDFNQQEIIAKTEALLTSHPEKQWHSAEIINKLQLKKLNKYVLNIILGESKKLSYLGKMIWALKNSEAAENGRLHIEAAIIDILRRNGSPMTIREIEAEVKKTRGMNTTFSMALQPNKFFSRINTAIWGLLDRDFILSFREWANIKSELKSYFENTHKALHISEILDHIPQKYRDRGVTAELTAGILSADESFKKWRGNFFGLSQWASPERLTIAEAVRHLAAADAIKGDISDITDSLKGILGYVIDTARIPLYLNEVGYSFNRITNKWEKTNHTI